ncbi:T9SS type A sorting domain-containing protein, partial [candidate division KSB1 bacterium]|nr:T9SS type A sorting domain-containing protein [candidate division KSB1 bacterium]
GEKYYRQLIETWPKDGLAQSALATLGEATPDTPRKPQPANAAAVVTDHLTLKNFPNPFNPITAIQFSLPEAGLVTVTIYDLQGRRIARLLDEPREAGLQIVRWNGQNEFGVPAASGTYFCKLRFKNQVLNQKIILLK